MVIEEPTESPQELQKRQFFLVLKKIIDQEVDHENDKEDLNEEVNADH